MLQDEALRLISNPSSPISIEVTGSDDVLKQLAIAWGVPNTDGMTASQLKINLRNAVIKSQDNFLTSQRGFKEFVDDANRLGDSDKRSTILLSIERGILSFDDNIWFVTNREGGKQFLLSIPTDGVTRKDDWIIKHLVKSENNQFYELVESLLTNPAPANPTPPKEEPFVRVDAMNLLKNEYNWPHARVMSMKDVKLKELVKNKTKFEE
jgi:hypothetical protein